MVSNHSKIKSRWQQSRTKCYHLLISWSCHYHPPLKLSRVSPLPNDEALCRTWEPLTAFANYNPGAEWRTTNKGKENAPAQLHGPQDLSVSEVWIFSSVKLGIHLVHRAHPVLGTPSRTTGVRLQVFMQTRAEACPLLLRWALMWMWNGLFKEWHLEM